MRNFPATVAAFVSVCALAACSQSEDGTTLDRRHPRPDATVVTTADAASTPTAGDVSCYTEGNPAQSCALPVHCCFSNYSSQHDGLCTTSAWRTARSLRRAGRLRDRPALLLARAVLERGSLSGYSLACQANACGAAPASYELCHRGGAACSNGGTCVTAYLNDNDLPRTLDICK